MEITALEGGSSPIADDPLDEFTVSKEQFLQIFDWILYNNGLLMEHPIKLN